MVGGYVGGLARASELAAHYIHPQMLPYQYLRAHPYHINPGRGSPHLALDPKTPEAGPVLVEGPQSPPLELCRATRTPQERISDGPQVAQAYMMSPGAGRLAAASPFAASLQAAMRYAYYDPAPPAHLRSPYPLAASEAPIERALTPELHHKQLAIGTPPPPLPSPAPAPVAADSLLMLLQRYPVMWQGLLALKNDQAAVQMHLVFGNPSVARDSLPWNSDGTTPPLRIVQRMRLEPTQVEGVARKMQVRTYKLYRKIVLLRSH